jgi:hypothetical protein
MPVPRGHQDHGRDKGYGSKKALTSHNSVESPMLEAFTLIVKKLSFVNDKASQVRVSEVRDMPDFNFSTMSYFRPLRMIHLVLWCL